MCRLQESRASREVFGMATPAGNCSRPVAGLRLFLIAPLTALLFLPAARAQNAGAPENQFFGRGVTITVVVHDASGEPISSPAVVKLLSSGASPAGQAETVGGRAEFFANNLGDFTVVAEAPGYASAQKDLLISA